MTAETVWITTEDGVDLHGYRWTSDGEPCVLTHGVGLCGSMFAPLAEELTNRFSSLAIDFRGHGASSNSMDARFSWDQFASDVAAACDVQSRPTIGIGHSLGATAMLLAELHRPGTFSRIYCFEPPMFTAAEVQSERFATFVGRTRQRRSTFASREDAIAHYRQREAFAALDEEALRAYVECAMADTDRGTVDLVLSPADEATAFSNVVIDYFEELSAITCPVILAYGEESDGPGEFGARRVADHLPNARLVAVPGVGHLGPFEQPAVVARSIITAIE